MPAEQALKRENNHEELELFLGTPETEESARGRGSGSIEKLTVLRDDGQLPILVSTRVQIDQPSNLHVSELSDLFGNPIYLAMTPLPTQFADHWELIWQENIGVIVWIGRLSGPNDEMHSYIEKSETAQATYFTQATQATSFETGYDDVYRIGAASHDESSTAVPSQLDQREMGLETVLMCEFTTIEQSFGGILRLSWIWFALMLISQFRVTEGAPKRQSTNEVATTMELFGIIGALVLVIVVSTCACCGKQKEEKADDQDGKVPADDGKKVKTEASAVVDVTPTADGDGKNEKSAPNAKKPPMVKHISADASYAAYVAASKDAIGTSLGPPPIEKYAISIVADTKNGKKTPGTKAPERKMKTREKLQSKKK